MKNGKRCAGPCGLRRNEDLRPDDHLSVDLAEDLETALACTARPSWHAFGLPGLVVADHAEAFRSGSFNEAFRALVRVEDAGLR